MVKFIIKKFFDSKKTDCGFVKIQEESAETKIKNVFAENKNETINIIEFHSNKLFALC